MTISKDLAPGRILFIESVDQNRLVGDRCKIVRIAGQRIVVTYPGSEKERFVYKPVICCDTEEEAQKVQSLSDNYYDHRKVLQEEFAARFNHLMGGAQ